jgi:predicted transcriptional regulator
MAKGVLLSIRPEWAGKIASGEKTVEVRKTRPKLETPFKCYIYCTLPKYPHEDFIATDYPNPQFYGGGKVIGEFMCYATIPISVEYSDPSHRMAQRDFPFTGMTDKQIIDYLGNGKMGYGWHISDLKIYDKPKELIEFHTWKKCKSCSKSGYESTACIYDENCMIPAAITKAPQSWCYVEELENG